jgi:hypothetical protein
MKHILSLSVPFSLLVCTVCNNPDSPTSSPSALYPVSVHVIAKTQANATYKITISGSGFETIGPNTYPGGQAIELYVPEGSARSFHFERYNESSVLTDTGTTISDVGSEMKVVVVTLVSIKTVVTPGISNDPRDISVTVGQTATFTITATGTDLQYQWQKGSTYISGATLSTYTTPVTKIEDNGTTYRCRVTNSANTITSNAATLTVAQNVVAPSIKTNPMSQSVTEGQTATFTISATGTDLKYQWKKGIANISGATFATYTTPATRIEDNGTTYQCEVSNSAETVASNAATLTVVSSNTVPVFTSSSTEMNDLAIVKYLYNDTLHAIDADGDKIVYTLLSNITGFTLSDSIISWQPTGSDTGIKLISVQVSDGKGGQKSLSWSINVFSGVLFDDFNNAFNDRPDRSHVLAAKEFALNTPTDLIDWHIIRDTLGTTVTDENGISKGGFREVHLDSRDDSCYHLIKNGTLHGVFTTSTSRASMGWAYISAFMNPSVSLQQYASLVGPGNWDTFKYGDLRTLKTIVLKVKGKSTVDIVFETYDILTYPSFDFYKASLTLDQEWHIIKIPVASIKSINKMGWNWTHGANKVLRMSFAKYYPYNAEIEVDWIVFEGMAYENFGFTYQNPK